MDKTDFNQKLALHLREVAKGLVSLAKTLDETTVPVKSATIEEVRAVLAAKKQEGKSITELLGTFGVVKLTDLSPDKYLELLEAAGKL